MKPNALIATGSDIEKIYVDFTSPETILKSLGFGALRPLVNYVTNYYREKINEKIIMLYDGKGSCGSSFSAYISGFDEIPSYVVFSLKDEKGNFAPLDERTLDELYNELKRRINEDDAKNEG